MYAIIRLIFSACLLIICQSNFAQDDIIDFESGRWDLSNAEVIEHLGRKSLSGYASLKDVVFENGVIEVDIAVADEKVRSYPGILFRIQSAGNYERFYVRPHRAGLYPDALQYTPAFNGIDGWQLYNGEGFTSNAAIPANEWLHLKLEVSNTRARVYINDMDKPALVISELKHGQSKGALALLGPRDRSAYFSNFRYTVDEPLHFDTVQAREPLPGLLTDWKISQPIPFSRIDIEKYIDHQDLGEMTWSPVACEPSGLVDVAKYVGRTGQEPDCIIAKTTIQADKDSMMQLMIGYSDVVVAFLNGSILFMGNSAYQSRDPSFLGVIGFFDALYLPLKKGENELLLYVLEAFGGWGFMCRDGNAVFEHADLKKIWQIDTQLKMPESAVYDKKRNVVYVSNFNRYTPPGQQFISKISPEGEILQLKWIEGMMLPLGVAIYQDKLYVVERRNVAEIDLDKAEIINRYPLPQPRFPNDIAIDRTGSIYVSDSQKDAIYKFANGEFEEWLSGERIDDPNGLCVDNDKLLVGVSAAHALKAVDLQTKEITTLVEFSEGIMDGIRVAENGDYLLSHYQGRLYRVTPTGQCKNLIHVPASRCADFEYVPGEKLFIIPTLEDNKIMAYKLE